MVTENSWAEVGEVTDSPSGVHPSVGADSLALFSSLDGIDTEPPELIPITNNGTMTLWRLGDKVRTHSEQARVHTEQALNPVNGSFEEDEDVSMCLHLGFPRCDQTPFGELFSSENDPQEDVKDSSAVPGVCGLRNLGNTCFMSAGLQCLSNTPTLLHFFVTHPLVENVSADSLTAQFSALLRRMWSGENRVVHPVDFKHSLGVNFPQFKDYRQHDCQEFLALLLDSLHEQLNSAGQASPPNADQTQSLDRFSSSSLSHSSESSGDAHTTFRFQPMPENVAPFRLVEPPNGSNNQSLNYSFKIEKNELALHLNSTSHGTHLHGLQDILKDAKTSNVNVLVEEQEANNVIRFDSDKFPRHEAAKTRELVNPNLLDVYDFDGISVSVKRIKDTNLLQEHSDGEGGESGGLDLKRIKLSEQNNYERARNKALFKDGETEGFSVDSHKQTNTDLTIVFKNGVNKHTDDEQSVQSSTSGQHADVDDCLTLESFPESGNAPCNAGGDVGGAHEGDILADQHWDKHLTANQSTIVDTFLGQFKSTVVCSECKHVSVTYEPFMYLSVPLPHAMERQIRVTYVPLESTLAVQILLTLNKQDKVRHLREELIGMRVKEGFLLKEYVDVVLAEVLDHHIAKILDDVTPLRHVNDVTRSIYALEVLSPPSWCKKLLPTVFPSEPIDADDHVDSTSLPVQGCAPPPFSIDVETGEPLEGLDDKLTGDSAGVSDQEVTSSDDEDLADKTGSPVTSNCSAFVRDSSIRVSVSDIASDSILGFDRDDWKSCAICLEDMNKDMRRHIACDCVLCEGCIENACKHNGSSDEMPCPMCNQIVKPNLEFVRIDKLICSKPAVRLLNVPVVFRFDTEGDGNNNQKSLKLFGHPNVLRLPSVMSASELSSIIKSLVDSDKKYSVLTVDGVGYHCSRCLYTKHCKGCPVPTEGEVVLRSADTLAIRFMDSFPESQAIQHPSMQEMRSMEPLSLYDCLKAFSESELLDEHNPWYCPMCQKNQCATKTLSVCRYPDFLIVYLKRFVFHNGMSTKLDNKVTYPLNGLLVHSPSSLHSGTPHVYNLYACVCHYGGVSAGHYTAYAKNPIDAEWHYFNDETVSRQRPQEEDFSNAYILFYQKQGLAFPDLNIEEPLKPNIDHLIQRLDSTMDQDTHQEIS